MTQKDNILQELMELQSSLANIDIQNVYTVPGGYFDNLVKEALNRIKALDAEDASEELNYLSPLLNSISKKMPNAVPADFFNKQEESIMQIVQNDNEEQTAAEELETLSPLLSGLKKEMPYSVPQGYFEELNNPVNIEEVRPVAKVISITRQKWFRYAAAAVVIGFVAIGSFVFINKNKPAGDNDPTRIVSKMMNKISTEDINKFVQLIDEESPVVASIDPKSESKDKNEIQELIKDIPDKDIQSFLDETTTDDTETSDDALMN